MKAVVKGSPSPYLPAPGLRRAPGRGSSQPCLRLRGDFGGRRLPPVRCRDASPPSSGQHSLHHQFLTVHQGLVCVFLNLYLQPYLSAPSECRAENVYSSQNNGKCKYSFLRRICSLHLSLASSVHEKKLHKPQNQTKSWFWCFLSLYISWSRIVLRLYSSFYFEEVFLGFLYPMRFKSACKNVIP